MSSPNILLIIADQWSTRLADGSGQNHGGLRTPGLDRLAAEGVRFTQSYSSFPLCCPARASFFTGLMPHNHRITENEEHYNDVNGFGNFPRRTDITPMGTAFKQAGYKTAYFGKEHAADYGWDGIDEFGSMKYSAGGMLAEGSAFDSIFTRDAISYLKQPHDDPFYMVLSLINPHDICKVLGGKVKGATFADAIFFCRTDDEPYLRDHPRPDLPTNHHDPTIKGMIRDQDYMYEELQAFSEDDWKRYIATYSLLMEKTDWYIELVLDTLKTAGLEDDTIVLFTTDHGDMMGSHKLIAKTNFYEESAKTMMLVRQPEKITQNAVSDALVSTIDLMPTMLDLCDLPIPEGIDGRSFKAQCYDPTETGKDAHFSVNHDGRMVRFGHYKYIRNQVYGEIYNILFDLTADSDETTNLYNRPGYEAISAQARQKLDDWLAQENLALTF